jgi:hypothetical protein
MSGTVSATEGGPCTFSSSVAGNADFLPPTNGIRSGTVQFIEAFNSSFTGLCDGEWEDWARWTLAYKADLAGTFEMAYSSNTSLNPYWYLSVYKNGTLDAEYPLHSSGTLSYPISEASLYRFELSTLYPYTCSFGVCLGSDAWSGTFTHEWTLPDASVPLLPKAFSWNTATGGVDFIYEVTSGFTEDAKIAVYWAKGPTFDDRIDPPIFSDLAQKTPGTYTKNVSDSILGKPPAGASHLLFVTDPDKLLGDTPGTLSLDVTLVMEKAVPKYLATEKASIIAYDFRVTEPIQSSFCVDFYRSVDQKYDSNPSQLLENYPEDPSNIHHEEIYRRGGEPRFYPLREF